MVLDFAVNDAAVSPNGRDKLGYSFSNGQRRGFEQLVRGAGGLLCCACSALHALQRRSIAAWCQSAPGPPPRAAQVRKSLKLRDEPAVVLLQFFSWNATRDKTEVGAAHAVGSGGSGSSTSSSSGGNGEWRANQQGQVVRSWQQLPTSDLDLCLQGKVVNGMPTGSQPYGDSFFWRTIEDELSTVAAYYDAPVMSLRNAAYHLLREQQHGFQVGTGSPAWLLVLPCLPNWRRPLSHARRCAMPRVAAMAGGLAAAAAVTHACLCCMPPPSRSAPAVERQPAPPGGFGRA